MNTVHRVLSFPVAAWLLSGVIAFAQLDTGPGFSDANAPVVSVSTQWSHTGVKPGGNITLAVILDIRKPFHVNWNQAKDPFIPTKIELTQAPPEIRPSTPVFPEAKEIEFGTGADKEKNKVFSGRTVIYMPMKVTGAAKPGDLDLELEVNYQACDDKSCLFPKAASLKPKLRVLGADAPQPINQEIFAGMKEAKEAIEFAFFGWDFKLESSRFGLLLLLAALGGFLLNFTPCVLPLIPIKIMGLSHAAGNRRRCFLLGLFLSAGVVAFWLGLAAAMSSISGFDAANKLFQYPAFTIGVGVIIGAMALGMCGFFAVSLPQWVYRVNPSQESFGGSFLFGIMTAVLSTPCTAPFMGAAAAWAITQSPAITFTTFGVIGAGMALPYFLLSAFPVLVNRMPRTGPASELIKQVMGLLMLAAGAYFLGTGLAGLLTKAPNPSTLAYWWVVAFFAASAGFWLAKRTWQITPEFGKRVFFGGLGLVLVLLAVGIGVRFTDRGPINWVYYTPERLAEEQKENKVIVLEFTAAWCLNCIALEKAVLHNPAVVQQLNSKKVAPIKVDITGDNPAGDAKLVEVGRRTIPYLVVYSPSGKPVFSSDAYTVVQLVEAIRQAAGGVETAKSF
jgi:thiol:disulfide interchange protein DsbD